MHIANGKNIVNGTLRVLLTAAALGWGAAAAAQGHISSLSALDQIRPGVTTAPQVRELLGPPARTLRFPGRGTEVLEYDAREYGRIVVAVTVSGDGRVQSVSKIVPSHP